MADILSSRHEKTLREQVITEDSPGTILRDFAALLDFVGTREIEVSGKHQLLPINLLPELNARLSHPIQVNLKRAVQKSYPYINGLYLLLRASGLSLIEAAGKRRVLALDQDALTSWRSLNPTERYFTLLETWFLRGQGEIIGERYDALDALFKCLNFIEYIPDRGLKIAGDRQAEQFTIPYQIGAHNLALLDMFGCVVVEEGKPEAGKGWTVARVLRTPFGDALLKLLRQYQFDIMRFERDDKDDADGGAGFGELQPILQPFFPEWRENLKLPEPALVEGLYIFKVSMGKIWRRIAISGRYTLEDLSNTILDAYNFDNDHLHQFTYRDRFGALVEVNHYYTEDPPLTSEVSVGEIPLRPGDSMKYLFDFGDCWRFDVKLESIDPANTSIKEPEILEEHGKAPRQYPSWDEDDEEDEDE